MLNTRTRNLMAGTRDLRMYSLPYDILSTLLLGERE